MFEYPLRIYEARKNLEKRRKKRDVLETSLLRYYLLRRFGSEVLNWEAVKVDKIMIVDEIATLAENERMKKIERGMGG